MTKTKKTILSSIIFSTIFCFNFLISANNASATFAGPPATVTCTGTCNSGDCGLGYIEDSIGICGRDNQTCCVNMCKDKASGTSCTTTSGKAGECMGVPAAGIYTCNEISTNIDTATGTGGPPAVTKTTIGSECNDKTCLSRNNISTNPSDSDAVTRTKFEQSCSLQSTTEKTYFLGKSTIVRSNGMITDIDDGCNIGFVSCCFTNISSTNNVLDNPLNNTATEAAQSELTGTGVDIPTNTGLADRGIKDILTNLLNWLLGIVGIIALGGFVISGIQYVISTGSEEMMETAKHNMVYSLIGIIVALGGVVIIRAIDAALNARSLF